MKKLLLALTAICITGFSFGQQNLTIKNEAEANRLKLTAVQDGTPYAGPSMVGKTHPQPPSSGGSDTRTLDEVKFSSSHNGLMLLVSESQVLTANDDLKMINFTQRAPESIVQDNGGGTNATGIITHSYSVTNGVTWDTDNVIIPVQGTSHCRYPSGGIYNPAGNTNPQEAYAVVAGPCTDDADWVQYYYGSLKLDGTNNDEQFYDNQNGNTFQEMSRLSFTTCADKAFVLGSAYDYNPAPVFTDFRGGVINKGVFNQSTSTFDWTQQTIHVPLAYDQNGVQELYNFGNIAFNDDGSIGYFVIIGVDSTNSVGYYPIVYKSLDFGQTWTLQSFYDFRNMSIWADYLIPVSGGQLPKPFFSSSDGFDAVVDNNGSLHLIGTISSSYSDNIDSLGFIWTGPAIHPLIFDVYQVGDIWEAYFIDSLIAPNGNSTYWTEAGGALPMDARIQAVVSPDRTKVMAVWVDTDPSFSNINEYPDIKGIGIDYTSGTPQSGGSINFTAGGDFSLYNAWHYVSDKAMDAGGGMFTVPVTISKSRDESYELDNVMDHYYVSDISFLFSVGIGSINKPSFSVEQNYPNPFTGQTQFKVTLEKSADVNVKITNVLGQEVSSKDYSYASGSHIITVKKGNMASGVYNFTVTANGAQVSKTMIVE